MREQLLADGLISPEDVELLHTTDETDEGVRLVVERYETRFASTPAEPRKADAQ
jgi:hypothetical protein